MNKQELDTIIAEAVNDSTLTSAEIPAIDLYVDQIINLVAEKQSHGSERYGEKPLTKTMINNYSKDGVITPVKGKKYTKEQILQILTVNSLKSTLSISEIKRMLSGAYGTEGFDGDALGEIYDRYMQIKFENKEYSRKAVEGMLETNGLDLDNDEDYIAVIGGIVSLSAYLRSIARAMIDAKFPEISEEESSNTEEDTNKKKEKKDKKEEKKEKKEEKKEEKRERKREKKENNNN